MRKNNRIRVGINGFGRIGRATFRRILQLDGIDVVVVNDTERDLENLVYLLRFDSVYGRLNEVVTLNDAVMDVSDKQSVKFHSFSSIQDVPWKEFDVDVVVEATGVEANIKSAHHLVARGLVDRVVVTNSHQSVDETIIISVNESLYDPSLHKVVSSSICDANAIAPVLYHLDQLVGIEHASVTTLHPWLSYQNLLDGPISSVANPGHSWQEYSLGRSSVGNLILKSTTAAAATLRVLPGMQGKLDAISFRVPTANVSASDFSIVLQRPSTVDEIQAHLMSVSEQYSDVISLNSEALVSGDFSQMVQSCVIDLTKMTLSNQKHLKLVSWYDNEWAYSCRVLDVVILVSSSAHE
jgi:glyceraldehyde 3-phosphate dehydrogenase